MRALSVVVFALLVGCGAGPVPQSDMDKIELAYIQGKVFADQPVECVAQAIDQRTYVACRPFGVKPVAQLWLYDAGTFYALNGPARGAYDGRLKGKPSLALMPLPLPDGIDTSQVFSAFTQ